MEEQHAIVTDPEQLEEEKQEPEDPNLLLILSLRDSLSPDEITFYKDKLANEDKKTMSMLKCYHMTKDLDDLINSMQRLFKKSN